MVLGFNHNLKYKDEVFHVQTEDSGVANPHIITLLYRGGVIISSKKTSYSDILKMDNLEVVVEELMKEQHKEMMRRLKSGEFDDKAFSFKAQLIENYEIPTLEPVADAVPATPPAAPLPKADVALLFELPKQPGGNAATQQSKNGASSDANSKADSLDDAIMAFFGTRDK